MGIWKKTAALCLSLMLALSSIPAIPAQATAAPGLTPSADPTLAVCPHCDTVPQWQVWDGTAPKESGHFYLTKELGMAAGISVSCDMVLNLNGQNLYAKKGGKMFTVRSNAKLVVMDASVEGKGSVSGTGSATAHGGIFLGSGGDIDLYGGRYWLGNQNELVSTGSGGIAYIGSASTMRVFGGTFYGASYKSGGAFAVNNGTLILQDADVWAGKASSRGDSIWVDHENSVIEINGSTVINGGVDIVDAQSVSLSGKPVIEKKEGGSAYSLKLASGVELELGQLEEGTKVGVTAAAGVFAGDFATADKAYLAARNMFFSEDEAKIVRSSGRKLVMTSPEDPTQVTCPHCDTVPQWTVWDGTTNPAAGHYYLAGDTEHTASVSFTASTETVMVLNLNGYTLNRESGRMFTVQSSAKLVVMDSSAHKTGAMRGADSSETNGALMMTYQKGTIEFLGGNFYLRDGENVAGKGGLVYLSTGTVTVYGGNFYGTEATNGGAIGVNSAKLYLKGGKFYPGTAAKGDTLYATGNSSIVDVLEDTVIEGGVQMDNITRFRIAGTPSIRKEVGGSAYSVKTTTPITVGTLGGIRKIGITGTCTVATFDTEAAAEKARKYFIAEEEGMCIQADGKTLNCVAFTDPSQNPDDPNNDEELNILLIGNSYSYYWPDELYMLLTAAGYKNVTVANVYYSGCYFERHWKWYESGTANYRFCINESSGRRELTRYDLLKCMAYKNWDIVSFQQSGRYVYNTTTPKRDLRASMEPWLGNLYQLLHSEFPYSRYYFQQSWAHGIGNGVSNLDTQKKITDAHRVVSTEVCEKYGFTRVPCGDAWELVRHDPLIKENNWTLTTRTGDDPDTTDKELLWDDLTHDGDVGGGQFLNACVWYEVVTGRSVLNVPCAPFYLDAAGNRYDLSYEKVMLLKNAAHDAVVAVYGEPQAVRGDLNDDGVISDADAMYLLRYTLFGEVRYPLDQSGDMDGDGAVSDRDALYLLRYTLFGETRYPLH